MVVKKYIAQLKSQLGIVAVVAVSAVLATGAVAAAMFMPAKTTHTPTIAYSAPPEVKGASTDKPSQGVDQGSSAATNSTTNTAQPTTTPASAQTRSNTSSTTPIAPKVPSTPTPPVTSPTPTPTITGLYLGQPYFDDSKAPMVTFTVPVTASGSGNVIISWVADETNATICSTTVAFATNEGKEVNCTSNVPSPPHGVWATATAGTAYAKTVTRIYIGGTSWE